MNNMSRKFLFIFLLVFLFSACITSNHENEVFVPVDYTEEDAVNDEIESVRALISDYPVKALWRSLLVRNNVPLNEKAVSLFNLHIRHATNTVPLREIPGIIVIA